MPACDQWQMLKIRSISPLALHSPGAIKNIYLAIFIKLIGLPSKSYRRGTFLTASPKPAFLEAGVRFIYRNLRFICCNLLNWRSLWPRLGDCNHLPWNILKETELVGDQFVMLSNRFDWSILFLFHFLTFLTVGLKHSTFSICVAGSSHWLGFHS